MELTQSHLPDFDPAPIDRLLIDLDDPSGGILPELESGFHVQALEQLAQIGQRMAAMDLPPIANAAHALKGQSLTLGLMALADAAVRLERAAKAKEATTCQQIAAGLPDLFDRAQAALAKRIHG